MCCLCTQGILSGAHKFVKDFSQNIQSFIEHAKKNKPFRWTQECQAVFDEIKQDLIGQDVMAFPTHDEFYVLHCDAAEVVY